MTRFFWDTHHLRDSHDHWDTHRRRDTHGGKDTHHLRDTHGGKDTHHLWDSHNHWDTHSVRDTHRVGRDSHDHWDTHHHLRDTHSTRDTHGGKDTHSAKRTRRAPRPPRGFVLVATLWTLAAMAVLAAYIDGVASADIERAATAKAALERELAQRSTQATLGYLLATGRMNHRGLMLEPEQSFSDAEGNRGPDRSVGVIALSGETYAGLGDTRFSIQDENGLVSVNFPRTANFAAALSYAGVASADIARIVPRVEDYVDMDDDLSLSGAERYDYDKATSPAPAGRADPSYASSVVSRPRDRTPNASRASNAQGSDGTRSGPGTAWDLRLPNPSNWTMATPLELRRVLGVDDLIAPDQWRRLMPMLTMRQTTGYNFNTMRPDVLAAVLELDQGAVDNILAERAERSVASLNRIAMLTGTHVDIDPMGVQALPSRFLRISIWHNASGLRSIAGMRLTPFGDAPWRIDYRYTEPMEPTGPPEPARTRAEPTGAHRDPTEPPIDNESSDAGVLQSATPLLQ